MSEPETVEISVSGKSVRARAGETIVHALWAAGMAEVIKTGCVGGVCGACTVTLRFRDDRPGGTALACLHPVEEGMEVFPCPVDPVPSVQPNPDLTNETLRAAFPTLDRCTKCGSCTTACPMAIPVMDSVLRMKDGNFDAACDDFTTCIHCGLCRFVCEDKVKPHNMGMWLRRSIGLGRATPDLERGDSSSLSESSQSPSAPSKAPSGVAGEWDYLLSGAPAERLRRAKQFRQTGKVEG